MPRIDPDYLHPIVTYIQWYFAKGASPEEIVERILRNEEFAGITRAEIQSAFKQAYIDQEATERVRLVSPPKYRWPDGSFRTQKPPEA